MHVRYRSLQICRLNVLALAFGLVAREELVCILPAGCAETRLMKVAGRKPDNDGGSVYAVFIELGTVRVVCSLTVAY